MTDQLKAFPKIFAVGHRAITNLLDHEVEVTEKVDGSQFCFGKVNGELKFRSKGAIIYGPEAPNLFKPAVDYIISIADKIPNNSAFYGETLCRPKHNTLAYDRTPKNYIALFGAADFERQHMEAEHSKLCEIAQEFDIDVVPLLFKGKLNVDELLALLNTKSVLGGSLIEGVVAKRYGEFIIADQVLPVMSGKYVSERFKEVHQANWTKENTVKGKLQVKIESYRTEARWWKAVQHLRDSGKLVGEPKDIGPLMKEIHTDLIAECEDEIKEFLWKEFKSDFTKRATAGFPEWYKEQLAREEINV